MALPSTRRPAIVEEEMQVELEQTKKNLLKIKVNLVSVFMDMMVDWYDQMSDRNRKRLTAKRLKIHAVYILHKLNYPYDKLPLDWVQKLMDRTGMILYVKQKKTKDLSFLGDREVSVTVDPLGYLPGVTIPKPPGSTASAGNEHLEESKMDTVDAKSTKDKDAVLGKTFVDLTKEPPPVEWLKAYSEGIHLPRALTVYSGDGMNIMFYDYNPKYKEEEILKNLSPQVHTGNSFDWFADNEN